jgi:hypothetical protein
VQTRKTKALEPGLKFNLRLRDWSVANAYIGLAGWQRQPGKGFQQLSTAILL